jgi:predicted ATP-grasp superfamily ATP-dependent carboligase
MDPKAAAMVLEVLNKLINIKIDTTALEEEAKLIDNQVKSIIGKAKEVHNEYKKVQENTGSMYG